MGKHHGASGCCQDSKIEALTRFAGGLAHNINNALSVVMGHAELIKMEEKKGDKSDAMFRKSANEHAQLILLASKKISELIGNLMIFGSNDFPSKKSHFDLKVFLQDLLVAGGDIRKLVSESIVIEERFCASDLVIDAGKSKIQQILFNLILNARDAMSDEGVIRIKTDTRVHKGNSYAVLIVCDSGVGMSEETQKKIFDPFFTTDLICNKTGLGLSVVYGAVQQLNGFIEVHSEVEVGTTISVCIPLVDKKPEEGTDPQLGGKETILVVDDDKVVRTMLCEILAEFGYNVVDADNGEEALRLYQAFKDRIDLVISDIEMPKMDGRKFFQAAKEIKPDLKIIFISGYATELSLRKSSSGERVDFLTKPVMATELLHKIRLIMS